MANSSAGLEDVSVYISSSGDKTSAWRRLVMGTEELIGGLDFFSGALFPPARTSTRDDVIGNPLPPSQRMHASGIWKFLWAVKVGARSISIDVLFTPESETAFRPRLIVKANPAVGLNDDLVAVSGASNGVWQTIGPLTFTATAVGVLEVQRERRDPREDGVVWWDNIVVS